MLLSNGSRRSIGSRCLQQRVIVSVERSLNTTTATSRDRKSQTSKSSRPDYTKFPTDALSYHWETTPPSPTQLAHASKFFRLNPPKFLWSAPKFKTMDFGDSPEVCFLGRSNVGKSSLLNTLLNQKIAHTSSKPGRTKLMNAFAIGGLEDEGRNRLVVLDMPGYGKGGRAEWGTEVLKYLGKRRQLKRAFLLIDAEHGIKATDRQILALFKEHSVPHQIIMSKADKVLFPGSRTPSPAALDGRIAGLKQLMEDVRDVVEPDPEEDVYAWGEVLACSSEKWIAGKRMGVDAVRHSMLQAAGLELKEEKLAKPEEIVPFDQIPGLD
ncbi:P-loop containing nucleoside triphosphate hydrolase protein [Amylocarpus encephaloides]|uniref:GTP-binding protein 8 n=1 Tax=Amylocarpus encephaloides TaxID=45428 RepID=A0A9P7YCB0_9HELO|nr:P-loop containing nucleoside triphosphate hydrolase protein [Amylocarpus encephaloides]